MSNLYALIGNWGFFESDAPVGVTVADYDAASGRLQPKDRILPKLNCGAACLDEARGILYCVNERPQVPGETLGGQVFALKIDPKTGTLTELSRSPSFGPLPSYCALDAKGDYLVVTNHSGRNAITKTVQEPDGSYRIVQEYDETAVVLFPLDKEGRILPPCDIAKHTGHGANPNQTNPHAHCVSRSPSGNLFAVCDKGNDSLYCYRIDYETRKLVCCDQLAGVPGSSPRYCVFHPTKPYLYYNNETKTIVDMVQYDENGALTHVCTVSCLEDGDEEVRGMQSGLCIDRAGTRLYTLVRDTSTITVYALDAETGVPSLLQTVACGSKQGGRGLTLSPDGRYLYLAAFPDDKVLAFAVAGDGTLTANGPVLEQLSPGVVQFAEL